MSAIRDVRLLIARHLDLPTTLRAAVLNTLNVLDNALDAEGWQEGDDVKKALRQLDHAVLEMDDMEVDTDEFERETSSDDLVDIDDIEIIDEDEDDEED